MERFDKSRTIKRRICRAFWVGFLISQLSILTGCAPDTIQPSPTPKGDELIIAFFDSWNRAVESGELEEPLDYFAEDATLETVGYYHLISNGREEIRTALEHWIGSGYLHAVDEYDISRDDEALYWNLEGGSEDNFCYGKIIIQGQKIEYLGYSTCKSS
jgi:hypothetical protein